MSEELTNVEDGGATSMPQGDLDFLMACLNNTTGGSVIVDLKAVAEAFGMTNHRSAGNRLANLRKKYNLPVSGSANSKVIGAAEGGGDTPSNSPGKNPKTPKTPTEKKARVTKPKAEKKATPAKSKAEKKDAVMEEKGSDGADSAGEEMEVKSADTAKVEDEHDEMDDEH